MMRKLKKFFSYSVYRKTLYIYMISVIVITITILVSLFGFLVSGMKKQTRDTSQQMLEQLMKSANQTQTDIGNVMSVISGSGNTLRIVSGKEESKSDSYSLFLELSKLKSFYSYIENISVWNLNTDVCVHLMGESEVGEENLRLAGKMQENRQYILSRDITIYQKTRNVISFFQYFSYQNSGIIIDVDADLFEYSLVSAGKDQRSIYIIDSEGHPVTKQSREILGNDNGDETAAQYLNRIVSEHEDETGRIVFDDAQSQQIVFLAKSESYNWWFGDIQNYSSFYEEYQKLSFVLIGGIGLLLLIIILATGLFSSKIQGHLLKIVNKCRAMAGMDGLPTGDELLYIDKAIARISRETYMNEQYIKDWFLKNLISGQGMPFAVSREKVRRLKESYRASGYAILLVKIHSAVQLPEEQVKEEFSIYRFTVCNLADEIFGAAYRCKSIDVEEDAVAILLLSDSGDISEEYLLCFQQLKEFAREHLDILLSGSMGCVVSRQEDIYLSYERARQYMQISNLTGRDELIDSNRVYNVNYQKKNQRLVESIAEYTKLNYANPELSLKTVSQMFHLSTAYLGKIFKSVQGESYAAFVMRCRLEESKVLLMETNKTIHEIASEVGFTNSTYFTTVFKSSYGMTPTAFRDKRI